MTTPMLAARAQVALSQRLSAAAAALGAEKIPSSIDPAADAARTLLALLERVAASQDPAECWLVAASAIAELPHASVVIQMLRRLELEGSTPVAEWLLARTFAAGDSRKLLMELEIVAGGVIVDVDYTARTSHNTGIQRVIRKTMPSWSGRGVRFVAGLPSGIFRSLTARELHGLLHWGDESPADDDLSPRLILPWKSIVVLTEVPLESRLAGVAALARFSGNETVAIGYDTIPATSRDTVSNREASKFSAYLEVVKHLRRIAGISATATEEFAGFASAMAVQGLEGPRAIECSLPIDGHMTTRSSTPRTEMPVVLCVGSKEPRKNHTAVMVASERLWREGLSFELRFVGSYGWDTREFRQWHRLLRRAKRPVLAPARSSDRELDDAYAAARFSVFPSLHEGFGLPVAESLAYGVPAITTNYGSTAEIAEGGGCLTVDPRNDDELYSAMKRLLTDDDELARLRAEALARKNMSWNEFADHLWAALIDGVK
jgi:glycosyltransferase involved in cell wall biosynthesis